MTDSDFAKEIESKPLRKKWFMSLPNGYCVEMGMVPQEHIVLTGDREQQWRDFSRRNAGRMATIYSSLDQFLKIREAAKKWMQEQLSSSPPWKIHPAKIAQAYANADNSLPRDPERAQNLPPGVYYDKLTKRLLMNLPTGAFLRSNVTKGFSRGPRMAATVPRLAEREGFWLEIKNMGLVGRTFQITVVESEE